MKKRVVITAMSVLSSLGHNPREIIKSFKEGRVSFERPPFDSEVVTAPVKNFSLRDYTGRFKDGRYLNRGAQFAAAAATELIRNSSYRKEDLPDAGIFTGTGPNLDIGGEFPEIRGGNVDREDLRALWILRFLPNTAASAIAKLSGIHGENLTISTACSASLQAIGEAYRRIKDGYLKRAFAGGGDSRLSPGGILAYKKANALYVGNNAPDGASRPFDKSRSGFVPGEGGAFFLLEELEAAEKRGVEILGEICGYGCTLDAYNLTAPEKGVERGRITVMSALNEAGVSPSKIEVISAHGTSTILNDEREAHLIADLYGKNSPRVIAFKSWIGHASAACGALELALLLVCMREEYLPEIRNLNEPCHGEINFVRQGKNASFRIAVIQNFGFGGQNSALIIRCTK
jgi:3-oxoacyl-[acyl-carrier-protein] synthase II